MLRWGGDRFRNPTFVFDFISLMNSKNCGKISGLTSSPRLAAGIHNKTLLLLLISQYIIIVRVFRRLMENGAPGSLKRVSARLL